MRHSLLHESIVGIHVSFPYCDEDMQSGKAELRVHWG